jgi:2-desacetyl-2-hydroxyethyl bacteriochlorophyllide A dehydrogenase
MPKPIGSTVEIAGAYADYFLGSEALLLAVPDAVPDAAAALVEPLAVAVHAVNKAVVKANTAVILGCGPIGLAIAAVLRMRGVPRIIAADFSPKRRELATAMGATEVVDARAGSALAPLMAGGPVVVFDCTGAKGVLARAVAEVPVGSEIVVAGIAAGEETISPMVAIAKELRLTFVVYYTPEEFAEALQLVADGKLAWEPLVTGRVGLDGVQQAFADLENPELHAKVMVDPSLTRA